MELAGFFGALATAIAFVVGIATSPRIGACPPGWTLHEGVRPNGETACWAPLKPPGCGEPVGNSPPCERPAIVRSRVYCGGRRAIVVNERVAGCQR